MEFRQLNCYVDVFTANAAKLREWRQKDSNISLLDLKREYLQVLFTNPSARAGYDTRSIFKRSLTGFEFRVFLLLD